MTNRGPQGFIRKRFTIASATMLTRQATRMHLLAIPAAGTIPRSRPLVLGCGTMNRIIVQVANAKPRVEVSATKVIRRMVASILAGTH